MSTKRFATGSTSLLSDEMKQQIKKAETKRFTVFYSLPSPVLMELKIASTIEFGMKGKSKWVSQAVREFLDESSWGCSQAINARPWLRVISDTVASMGFNIKKDKIDLDIDLRAPSWHASMDSAVLAASEPDPVYIDATIGNTVTAAIIWKLSKSKRIAY
jgi:hypothetical protein